MAGEALEHCRVEQRVGIPGDRGWALRDEQAGEIRGAKKIPRLLQLGARYREEPTGERVPPVEIRLPDGELIGSDDAEVSARLSQELGRTLTLCARRPADDLDHYRRAEKIEDLESEMRAASELLPEESVPKFEEFAPELLEFVSPPGTYFDGFELHVLTSASLAEFASRAPGCGIDARRFRPNVVIATDPSLRGFPEFDWCGRQLRIGDCLGEVVMPMLRCGMTIQAQAELQKDPRIMRALVRETDMTLGVGVAVVEAGAMQLGDAVEIL
ncbi:MAG: MOSC domain-containing protein [Deltaproteobacteria bacterium]|nr:MOSC domain-containing protein [Deltaproteobacteria bacterium]MBW2362745.1 MOSC domain-containing protein [Deltaproteobacteria bacterium]